MDLSVCLLFVVMLSADAPRDRFPNVCAWINKTFLLDNSSISWGLPAFKTIQIDDTKPVQILIIGLPK